MTTVDCQPVKGILAVEDSAGDACLLREAFAAAAVPNRLHIVSDGIEALNHLHMGIRGEVLLPDLIVMDLNLPRMDGRELLSEIKRDPPLRRIPIVILTTSSADTDVARCYDLHANCYLVKPMSVDEFFAAFRSIASFWLQLARLPTKVEIANP